jgi:hypothetical protein
MRAGSKYFLEPSVPAQRRYEALRGYIVEEVPAADVACASAFRHTDPSGSKPQGNYLPEDRG